jgi:hypothetical protein
MPLHTYVLCWDILGMYPKAVNSGNSHIDNDEPKGNGALDIHLYLPVLAYLHACKISMGLTPKEWDRIIHRAKWFRREGNSLLCVWIDG